MGIVFSDDDDQADDENATMMMSAQQQLARRVAPAKPPRYSAAARGMAARARNNGGGGGRTVTVTVTAAGIPKSARRQGKQGRSLLLQSSLGRGRGSAVTRRAFWSKPSEQTLSVEKGIGAREGEIQEEEEEKEPQPRPSRSPHIHVEHNAINNLGGYEIEQEQKVDEARETAGATPSAAGAEEAEEVGQRAPADDAKQEQNQRHEEEEEEEGHVSADAGLWWRAVKLPMYSVAVAPLTVAGAMCHHWYGCVNAPQFGAFAAGACLVIAWLNLSNDAWDAATGVDSNGAGGKPESVVRLLGGDAAAVRKVHGMAAGCLALGAAALLKAAATTAAAASGNLVGVVGAMLASAVALGHAYQGPPFRLSYKGLGEPICFAAFGPLAVGAFYLALAAGTGGSLWTGPPPTPTLAQPGVMGAAALVGLTTTAILFTSHFHQEKGDREAGKMSPVVRLGLPGAVKTLRGALAAHHVLAVGMAAVGALPQMGAVGVMAVAPLAAAIERFAAANQGTPASLFKTKYFAVRWHVAHAMLLALGCVVDPWMPWHLAAARVSGLAVGVVG